MWEILKGMRTRLFGPKQILSIPPAVEKTPRWWYEQMSKKTKASDSEHCKCPVPNCAGALLSGPSGGMSTNVKCDTCDRRWNLTEIIQHMEPID